ncbi:carbamoyltransferase [Mesorhizobium sp. M1300]|uniref:carbamoyltransferase family protein n=1 Tax=Mesorhizobium sp. M1300 TaxID=2957077 RepID=UPI0033357375
MTNILGISAFYHDSAASLVVDGAIISAAQEERFTRRKADERFPSNAIRSVLQTGGVLLKDVDYVVFYEKPLLKFSRLLETYLDAAPSGFDSFRKAMPAWLTGKLFQKRIIFDELRRIDRGFKDPSRILFSEHHVSHAASAFFPSPFNEAVVLTIDGVGEKATTTVAIGRGATLDVVRELRFPHSLGLLYAAFCYYLGFKINSGEYKVMGLAPYGVPRFKSLILEKLVDLKEDGTFRLDQSYFAYATGLKMTNARFASLFGQPVRRPDTDPLTDFHMDVAASIQAVADEIVLRLTRSLARDFAIPNLCMAGGVALNCVANGKVLRDGAFKRIWVQPAAGDAGGSLGAALAAWHLKLGGERVIAKQDSMKGSYLGPEFGQSEIEAQLSRAKAVFEVMPTDQLIDATAAALADGKAVGWFQGRMEFGPRALGNRSILADPRSDHMQKTLNLKVKFRESFRPFAPSVLSAHVSDWFDLEGESPYMLLVAPVKQSRHRAMTASEAAMFGIDKLNVRRSEIPAVTHVDYSARIQTVHVETNPLYHALITRFEALTGCPVLVNTSFNVRSEPIVCSPTDAFRCFMGTDLDVLVAGNCVLHKPKQDSALAMDYRGEFEPD